MSNWNKNNRACTTLWSTLFTMNQLSTNFDNSGSLKMRDLTYYNNLSIGDLLSQDAEIIADQLDNVFRHARGAKFESGIDHSKALSDMIQVLSKSEKSVEDLAEAIDALYFFWGE